MTGPHQGRPVRGAGAPLENARALVLLVHGRGATAESILELAPELGRDDVAYLAPQAAGFSWYPDSFLAPIERNQPGLSSALEQLDAIFERAGRAGIPDAKQIVLGFSQGACLALEYAARNPRRYGGVIAFTGGLLGPHGSRLDRAGSFAGTPVFLGSSDPDPHVPWTRVEETARVFERMEASVDLRRYPGMAHTVNAEELAAARDLIGQVARSRDAG